MKALPMCVATLLASVLFDTTFISVAGAQGPPGFQMPAVNVNLPGMSWASLKSLPDFTGTVWMPDGVPRSEMAYLKIMPYPPLKAAYLADAKAEVKAILAGEDPAPSETCKFDGMPRLGWYPYPLQFLYRAGSVTLQADGIVRSVDVSGLSTRTRDAESLEGLGIWGESSAEWQGDTLVIRTAYARDDRDTFYGVPNDPQMKLTERYRLLASGRLERLTTLEAPQYLERPWSSRTTYARGGTPAWATRFCLPKNLPDRRPRQSGVLRPAPAGARFTPNLGTGEAAALTDKWGSGWTSPRAWDNTVVYVDRITLIPPLKPDALKAARGFLQRAADGKAEFRFGACYPEGLPRSTWFSYPPTFNFLPGGSLLITVMGETREIFMDGRAHPAHLDPADTSTAYLGHSVGWWDGDTLVIDSVGFSADHELFYDVPNGGGMHVVERYSMPNEQTLALELRVEDPQKLTTPWIVKREYSRNTANAAAASFGGRGTRIEGVLCRPDDGGRERIGSDGKSFVDLTPPKRGQGIGSDK